MNAVKAHVLVIGDDLTGSNATGARFARAGLRTVSVSGVERVPCAEGADVVVLNLGTRQYPADRARELVREAVGAVTPVDFIAKRVDTTLRGNVGAEVDALLGVLEPGTRALVVPAFPDAGRTTVGGLHLVDGVPLAETSAARDPLTPVRASRVATILRQGTDLPIAELPLDVVESGVDTLAGELAATEAPLVVCDATTNAHLGIIAEAAAKLQQQLGTRWVSVDSGPFAVQLTAALGIGPGVHELPPVLAVVASITGTTQEQVLELEQVLRARFVDVALDGLDARAIADRVAALLRPGVRVAGIRTSQPAPGELIDPATAERIPRVLAEAVSILLTEHRFGGLYATGGDMAEATTAALASDGFAIDAEVLPLAVAGRLVGGPHDGLPFATKGGLIGGRDAALACVEHLISVSAQRERGTAQ
ncbi:four-carbon acid sugar kinase family protein [Prauserella sp. PE36]|uniref:four-carbon acid sugar kinase family protein n=1 Tax=Prauserella sp. PE36 TaxID=1504709 RepID=UPI001F33398A|nr:four-carbon acid sugar kinase family protein [Prauserella sp. PE36]